MNTTPTPATELNVVMMTNDNGDEMGLHPWPENKQQQRQVLLQLAKEFNCNVNAFHPVTDEWLASSADYLRRPSEPNEQVLTNADTTTMRKRCNELMARYEGNGNELTEPEITELRNLLNDLDLKPGQSTIARVHDALHRNGYDDIYKVATFSHRNERGNEVHRVEYINGDGELEKGNVYIWRRSDGELVADY